MAFRCGRISAEICLRKLQEKTAPPDGCSDVSRHERKYGIWKTGCFAAELALRCRNGEHIVIICGNNAKIERILRKEFHFNKRVHIIGYTNHVSLFMDACDVIYTKPGGLTSTESLVKIFRLSTRLRFLDVKLQTCSFWCKTSLCLIEASCKAGTAWQSTD